MPTSCSAYKCTNHHFKGTDKIFHRFPLNNNELLKKWIVASKRDDFIPSQASYMCSDHFTRDDYLFSNSKRLKPNSVPSKFDFPQHLQPTGSKRKAPFQRNAPIISSPPSTSFNESLSPPSTPRVPKSPSKDELKEKIIEQQKKIKTLQQKVRRKEKKVSTLKGLIDDLSSKQLINNDIATTLNENFSGLTLELIKNQFNNQSKLDPRGRRHNDEAKKFVLTLNFYSSRAYEYVRTVFSLPHSRSLSSWTSSVECSAGLFQDVFAKLKTLVNDCSLICDAMSIMEKIFYNRSTGKYDGYIDYGKDIVIEDEDVVAKKALVSMLVTLIA